MSDSAKGQATITRLGRVVRTAGGPARPAEPEHREEHRQANWLRDVILGGQDGLVNILGIILGVGAYQAMTLVGDWRRKGLQMVAIGLGAAAIGFLIGRLFHTAGA
jgi:hypothetical protein